MPKFIFLPNNVDVEVEENTKILVSARRANVPIRFGCGAGLCGMCAVKTEGGVLSDMKEKERLLLNKIKLKTDGTIRLACQAKIISGVCKIDLNFQSTYSPDIGMYKDEN